MAEKQWDVVVVGGTATDYMVHGPCLPEAGESVRADSFEEDAGGKGVSQAIAAARLGAKVALISKVGADRRGEEILARLKKEGVETEWVSSQAEGSTGAALVSVDAQGRSQVMTYAGASLSLEPSDVKKAVRTISSARVVLVQMEVPVEVVAAAIDVAAGVRAKTVLDVVPASDLPDRLLRLVDVIRLNSKEAEVFSGRNFRVVDRAAARLVAEKLLFRGVAAAIVQGGEVGNLLAWGEHEFWVPRFTVKQIDSTGASDAFSAGVAVGLSEGLTLPRAAQFGAAAAALASTVLGGVASLPKREDVLALLEVEPGGQGRRASKAA